MYRCGICLFSISAWLGRGVGRFGWVCVWVWVMYMCAYMRVACDKYSVCVCVVCTCGVCVCVSECGG